MSGGVDSSVAACLLKEQGYDVVGVFMRVGHAADTENGCELDAAATGSSARSIRMPLRDSPIGVPGSTLRNNPVPATGRPHQGCCSAADAGDARVVAGKLGIPFYALNFAEDFSRLIDYFADEYANARTPNPCVVCNQWLKFGKLMNYAEVVEADFIATGHYARLDHSGPRPRLLQARDAAKDQSYVLFGVAPDVLRRTLFPVGEMTKDEVRATARRLGLSLADKPDSQDICFVPDRDYARVVRAKRPDAFRSGRIRHVDGRDVGEHDGLPGFTIGQRRGVRVAMGTPVYVVGLDAESDTVVIGPKDSLLSSEATASRVNWLIDPPTAPIRADVKIRYHHDAAPATVHPLDGDRVRAEFDAPQSGVTPGQAMVFYQGDEVLGGGWIDRTEPRP